MITPPPISPPDWAIERVRRKLTGPSDRTNENTRKYADRVILLGKELNVPVVDAFEAIWSAAVDEAKETGQEFEKVLGSFYWDGLHLSVKGYKQVVDRECLSFFLSRRDVLTKSECLLLYRGKTSDFRELS